MWIAYAFGSALFAGLTSILAKCGIKQTDSNAATALRTIVVLVFSWLMVLVTGADHNFAAVSGKTWCFLLLSGLATGASWSPSFFPMWSFMKRSPENSSSACSSSWAGRC